LIRLRVERLKDFERLFTKKDISNGALKMVIEEKERMIKYILEENRRLSQLNSTSILDLFEINFLIYQLL
jgi:hypothetical protein